MATPEKWQVRHGQRCRGGQKKKAKKQSDHRCLVAFLRED